MANIQGKKFCLIKRWWSISEYEHDTIMDPRLLVLGHTFRYPHQVPDLLLPQPHVREEYTIMELETDRRYLKGLLWSGSLLLQTDDVWLKNKKCYDSESKIAYTMPCCQLLSKCHGKILIGVNIMGVQLHENTCCSKARQSLLTSSS